MPIESVVPSNHLILCHPLLLLPSIFPSRPARGAGTLIPSAQRLVWAAKQVLGKAALGGTGESGLVLSEEGNPAGLSSCSGGLRPLVELCVEPAGLCGRVYGTGSPWLPDAG